jgi:hypothetical protein
VDNDPPFNSGGYRSMPQRLVVFCLVALLSLAPISANCQEPPTPTARPAETPSASAPVAKAAEPSSNSGLVLQDGTPIKLRIGRTISSADAHTGDSVDFEVLEEVKVGDLVVVPKGGTAIATVTEAQPKRRMGRGGKLNVNIDYVRMVDGDKVALRAVKETKGGGHTGAMTGAMVATGIVFFPAAPLFLFMHGKDITVPKGTEITAYVNGDVKINPAKLQPPSQNAASTVSATAALSKVQISSQPAGADIEVDGSFVGNTPSVLSLAPGDHVITIKKSGYKDWERKMKLTAGDINLAPELEKAE